MREVTPESAAEYLRETGRVPAGRAVAARALGWGVSNVVIRVDVEGEEPFVLKQSRARLRTRALWVSRLERIWTEQAALELLGTVLPGGTVPEVLFADPDNFLFAMSCAPDDSVVWKERLLAGEADEVVARRAGEVLGAMHARTVGHPALASGPLADTTVFGELRVEPFYSAVARAHPEVAGAVAGLVAAMEGAAPRRFVHADFSPKNILVHARGLTLVDFETAHAGDPAFDLGFFLSHLLLKAFHFRDDPLKQADYQRMFAHFWEGYRGEAGGPEPGRVNRHAAACALARVDGTSPVDYLDEEARGSARRFALEALRRGPGSWPDLLELAAREMRPVLPGRG